MHWIRRILQIVEMWVPGGLAKPTMMLSGGAAAGQLVLLFLMPLATRLYGPEAFGFFAIYIALATFEVVICLGYDRAIAVPASDSDAWALVATSVFCGLFIAMGAALLLPFAVPALSLFVRIEGLADVLWLLPVGFCVVAPFQALTGWSIRCQRFKALSLARFTQYGTMGVFQVAMGLWAGSAVWLVVGHILGYFASACVLAVATLRHAESLRMPRLGHLLRCAFRYRQYALYGAPSALMNSVALQFPALALGSLYGATVAGWYALTQRAIGAPTGLIAISVWQSLRARLSSIVRLTNSGMEIRRAITGAVRIQTVPVLGIALLSLFAPSLFAAFFGEQWKVSGVYLQLIVPWVVAELIVAPLHAVFDVFMRADLHLIREVVRAALFITVFQAARAMRLEPGETLICFSISSVIVYGISVLLIRALLPKSA